HPPVHGSDHRLSGHHRLGHRQQGNRQVGGGTRPGQEVRGDVGGQAVRRRSLADRPIDRGSEPSMLARRIVQLCLATAVAVAGLSLATATPALADYVYCPPYGGDCVVVVGDPGGPGSPGGPGGGGGGGGGCPKPYVQQGYGCYSDF